MLTRILLVLLLVLPSLNAEIFYSYFDGKSGGIAHLSVNLITGQPGTPETLYLEEISSRLETLYITEDFSHLVGQNEDTAAMHLVIGDLKATPPAFTQLALSDRPRAVALSSDTAYVAGHDGKTHAVSLKDSKVVKESDPSEEMKPSAMRPEDVEISPDGSVGLAVYLQDSTSGKSMGSRLIVQELPSLALKHDLKLPRDHGELDFMQGSKDRGPLPHTIFIDKDSNTIALLCRLYGAVAFMDLDAALTGELKNFQYVATDDAFGTGFPERGSIFQVDGHPYLFVSNASEKGGVVFFDLKTRKIAARIETGSRGMLGGVYLPESKKLVSTKTGIQWERGGLELESGHKDGKELLVFDVSALPSGGEVGFTQTTWGDYVYNVGSIPGTEQFVITSVRTEEGKLDLVTVDLNTMQPVGRTPSIGVLRNFVTRPNP